MRCKTYFFRIEIHGLPNTLLPNDLLHIPIRVPHGDWRTHSQPDHGPLWPPPAVCEETGYVTAEYYNSSISSLITRLKIGNKNWG